MKTKFIEHKKEKITIIMSGGNDRFPVLVKLKNHTLDEEANISS